MVTAPEFLGERLVLTCAVGLLFGGAFLAWTNANAMKRVAGVFVAQIGAIIAIAVLGAPSQLFICGVAVAFGQLTIGAALLVRLQEAYGAQEIPAIDMADAGDEPGVSPP